MRAALAWALFIAGDLVSRVMVGPFGRLYPIYNRLMIWSVQVQGQRSGPWKAP